MLEKLQRVLPRHAAANATAQQAREPPTATAGINDSGYKSPITDERKSALGRGTGGAKSNETFSVS
jgi:hypothetical protein